MARGEITTLESYTQDKYGQEEIEVDDRGFELCPNCGSVLYYPEISLTKCSNCGTTWERRYNEK